MVSKAYFDVSVVIVKGLEESGRWRAGHDRKSFFKSLNNHWQAGVQSHQLSFLVRSRRGQVTVE